jgi:site-specific recombinase XerD
MPHQHSGPASSQLEAYKLWLEQNISSRYTRRNFYKRVDAFLTFLDSAEIPCAEVFNDAEARDLAVAEYKTYLQPHLRPNSINGVLVALNHFFRFIGVGKSEVTFEYCLAVERKVLTAGEKSRFLEAAEQLSSVRDKAIIRVLVVTGIRIGACAALNVSDIQTTRTKVILKLAKYRTLALTEPAATDLLAWLSEREKMTIAPDEKALFLNRFGRRVSVSNIDLIIRKTGWKARLEVSAEVIRRTYHQNVSEQEAATLNGSGEIGLNVECRQSCIIAD